MTYTATVGEMTALAAIPESSVVDAVTPMEVSFLPDHQLPANSRFKLTFPADSSVTA